MQFSIDRSPQKVQNILIRHSCSQEVRFDSSFQSPEKLHLLKYAPKYYKTLSLEVANSNPLQSKIKKIKKLKNFKGYFKKALPPKLWLNLLATTRKEIEEIPQITTTQSDRRPSPVFWARLMLWKVKFLPNITSLCIPKRKTDFVIQDHDDVLPIKKTFLRYLKNMKKIKTLEIVPHERNKKGEKWIREKLDGTNQFLSRLEKLTIQNLSYSVNIQVLLENRNLASILTSLTFPSDLRRFDNNLVMIPQICKNLRFLSIGFQCNVDNNPVFLEFLTLIQSLPQLKGLEFAFPTGLGYYWRYFKPKSSLRYLKVRLEVSDFIGTEENLVGHWEEIKELDELEFSVTCRKIGDLIFLRGFITMVMKKVKKLGSLKFLIVSSSKVSDLTMTGEPFLVEEIPHLYESLKTFEYTLQTSRGSGNYLRFDMKKMKVFRNLREFKLEGNGLYSENIEEMVELLEENSKEGDFPTLEIKLGSVSSANWLKDTIEKLKKIMRPEKKLKIKIDLRFVIEEIMGNELKCLDEFCQVRKSAGFIKGLLVCFRFFASNSTDYISIKALKEVMRKFGDMRNLMVEFGYMSKNFHYRNIDGEKEQFFVDSREDW